MPTRTGPAVSRRGATRAAMIALLTVNALLLAIAALVMMRPGPVSEPAHRPQPAPAPAPVAPSPGPGPGPGTAWPGRLPAR